jgi:hypothetical protein
MPSTGRSVNHLQRGIHRITRCHLTRYSRFLTVAPLYSRIDSTSYPVAVVVECSSGGDGCLRLLSTLDSSSRETLKTGCRCQCAGMSRTNAFSSAFLRRMNGPAYGCRNFRELLLSLASPSHRCSRRPGSNLASRNTSSAT